MHLPVECSHAHRRPWFGAAPPNPPEFGRYYGKGMRIDYVLVQRAMRARLVRTEARRPLPPRPRPPARRRLL